MMVMSNVLIQEDVIDQLLFVMDMPPAVTEMMKQIVVMNIYVHTCIIKKASQITSGKLHNI